MKVKLTTFQDKIIEQYPLEIYYFPAMNMFSKIFRPQVEEPNIRFGRYSDSFKEDQKYDSWDIALELYENQKYLESFVRFLNYLRDDETDNVVFEKKGDNKISFEIFQGSKKIVGYATDRKVFAEAKIAKTSSLEIGFLRRLVEKNYGLEYARYALDNEDCITMVFDTNALDASPYKLYYAFKELATNADKQDDILVSEFKSLSKVNTGHVRVIPEEEINAKYEYYCNSIDSVLNELDEGKLNITHYPGGASYLILDLIYRLDYLVKPEGVSMEDIEYINDIFLKKQTENAQKKNALMRKELKRMREITIEEFSNQIYEVLSTFGVTMPSGPERLRALIDSDLDNMDWYVDNNHPSFALAIPGYIVGNCLHNYAMPAPDKALLLLFYKVMYNEYFRKLKFSYNYNVNGVLQKSEIIKAIKKIRNDNLSEFPSLNISTKMLNFDTLISFAKSYLIMIRQTNVIKRKKSKK